MTTRQERLRSWRRREATGHLPAAGFAERCIRGTTTTAPHWGATLWSRMVADANLDMSARFARVVGQWAIVLYRAGLPVLASRAAFPSRLPELKTLGGEPRLNEKVGDGNARNPTVQSIRSPPAHYSPYPGPDRNHAAQSACGGLPQAGGEFVRTTGVRLSRGQGTGAADYKARMPAARVPFFMASASRVAFRGSPSAPARRAGTRVPGRQVRGLGMLVDLRPHARLRGKKPLDVAASLVPVVEALTADTDTDLAKVRLVCDWVQYKESFRDVVEVRPILGRAARPTGTDPVPIPSNVRVDDLEVAVDVRRSADVALRELAAARLREVFAGGTSHRTLLEDWGPGSQSCIWDFNSRYWADLERWERSTGRGYEQALPGGESDARNADGARDLIRDLFAIWDPLADSGALPEELYVVELGVGNGGQARTFLDEFRRLDEAHGRGYYQRLHYLMCDYSQHVLNLAKETVADHLRRVSLFALDATRPLTSLGFLKFKVFLVYISNVYDNLPTDEVAQMGGVTYQVQTRAYLPDNACEPIAERTRTEVGRVPGLVRKLLRLGPALLAEALPAHFDHVHDAVMFWRDVWSAIRLEERYRPLADLDTYELAEGVSGETLRPLLESGADVRMHVNNDALASFVQSLKLLHPFGKLVCHDLFVTDLDAYRNNFRGPGKYDGSVVNWVNGPLLAHVGRRHGFDVTYTRFGHRTAGNIVTMTAQVRD
ncbi:hypothetical protein AB0912_21945 [Streptomyces sp. NPDC007084]|uniref:hypothetical protein n=1 Tax=Streptomyces sp. NPDC007084 TaxID=3154313 RepID=UPI0034547BE1